MEYQAYVIGGQPVYWNFYITPSTLIDEINAFLQRVEHEMGALLFMLTWYDYENKTLIVADRGYESYNVIAHFLENPNLNFLITIKQDRSAMREIKK